MSPGQSKDTIPDLVLEFLELLTEPMKRVARFASIPNAFTLELIQQMTSEETDIAETLEILQEHYFINKGEGDWYFYSSDVRAVLRVFWERPEQLQEFQKANRVAIGYFDDLADRTNPPGNYVFQREALYHRLITDERVGLEHMADLFEQACDQRQIGFAQNLSIQLSQTLPQLSPVADQHASYYELRLDFLLNRRKKLEGKLEVLIQETSDPLLKARTGILLGQVWLARYEWKKSAEILKASLESFRKLKAWRFATRAMLVLGDIYVDLVENSGGVQPESASDLGRSSQFLTRILFLPFLLLDWLRSKIWFVPGWFYFSGNYQDWILNYLLQMAGNWYRKAWRVAQNTGDDFASLNALIGQANVAIQQRREAKAKRIYSRLARLPAIHSSRYRLAQIIYGQGQVFLLANRPAQANQELQMALNIFRSFADGANIALVARALGTTYLQLGDNESAAKALLESFQAYQEMGDSLPQTQVSWDLEQMVEKKQLTTSMEQQIKEALANIQEKQYLARFPSDLLRRFRALAYWVALPLSYLLILIVGVVTCLFLIFIEYSALKVSSTGRLSTLDIIDLLVVGVLPIPLTFWIIELVYAVVGQVWVFMAGRNSLNSLGEQPNRIILTSEALLVRRAGLGESLQLDWNEVQKWVSADYKLWQRPIHLLSRQGVVNGGKAILIEGITSGYTQIRKAIAQKIGGHVHQLNADMVMLAHRSTYIAVLTAFLHALFLVRAGQIDLTIDGEALFLSALLVFFIVNVIMIFPPLMLWRIYLQRRLLGKQFGNPPRGYRNFIPLSVAILLSIVGIVWLILSPFL